MKINKILAAGVAATLAVTSLSAAVSAEKQSKEYDIYITQGTGSKTVTIQAEVNKDIAQHLSQNKMQAIVLTDLNDHFEDADVDAITITVSGYQTKNASSITTKEFKFAKGTTDTTKAEYDPNKCVLDATGKPVRGLWYIVVLDKKTPVYHDGELASFYFDTITSLKLDVTVKGTTLDEDNYKSWDSDTLLTVGGIDIWDVNYATGKLFGHDAWVFGEKHAGKVETTDGDIAVNDKDEVIARAAAEVIDQATGAVAADVTKATAKAGKAILIGTPVGNSAANARVIGSDVIDTQKIYETTTTYIKNYTELTKTGQALALLGDPVEVTEAKPIVINDKVITTGYIYEADAADTKGGVVYTTTKLTKDADVGEGKGEYEKVQALVATKATADLTAIKAGAKLLAQSATYEIPVIAEVDKTAYDHMTVDSITDANAKIVPYAAPTVDLDGTADVDNGAAYLILTLNGKFIVGTAAGNTATITAYGYDLTADSVTPLLAYSFANGGWYTTKTIYGDKYTDGTQKYKLDRTTKKLDAWLPVTTLAGRGGRDKVDYEGLTTITRWDVDLLSDTAAYFGASGGKFNNGWIGNEYENQTYKDEMINGTKPLGFAGLASQVANWFNQKDNGEITFQFKSAAAAGATDAWQSGIPSTEVGLIGSGAGTVTANFALFFNYDSTGGVMLSKAKADLTAGTVTFDISDYLAQCGGLTMATLHDIYYGLNVGYLDNVHWSGAYGMFVDKVTLSYDDAAAAADAATDDADATDADTDTDADATVDADDEDDDTAAVVDDDEDDEDDDTGVIADDEDDDEDDDDTAAVISDDDEDDTAAAGDTDIVEPATTDDNPATGVGLAVIPAIVAAAAMAISKKRK